VDDGIAVFFDLGETLADPRISGGHLTGLDVYPFALDVLARLRDRRPFGSPLGLGLMSNTGAETGVTLRRLVAECGLGALVDQSLCLFSSVEGLDKSRPEFFQRGHQRAALPPARCVFVGESAAERSVAASVGFRVSPHPLHALHFVETALTSV
jgi:FMN phosphatase YigB (HAD superfamily)